MDEKGVEIAARRRALLEQMLGAMTGIAALNEGPSPADAAGPDSAEPDGGAADEWLSVRAACDYIHVSRTTLYRLVREGKLPSHRVRGRILINRETLDRCIKDGLLA